MGSFSCKLYSCIISLFFININVSVCEPTRIRLVTWNAADNKEMFGGFTDAAIDNVLGLVNTSREQMPGIYALAIEENCWMCNEENWIKFGHRFQERINKRSSPTKYKLIGVQGTRKSGFCEAGCSLKTHGSTLIVVIAKGTFASTHVGIRLNSECSSKYIPNKEKGVAAIRYTPEPKGASLCFAAVHLDVNEPDYRRHCLKKFFTISDQKLNYSKTCDFSFLMGDFNTKTGDQPKEKGVEYISNTTNMEPLKLLDEMNGERPYGTDKNWDKNLLHYINSIQIKTFQEKSVDFLPTFSIKDSKKFCKEKSPCYRKDRPKSWTDRILFTKGKCLTYDAVYKEYGDHFPVFAEFLVDTTTAKQA